ncbi:MAG: BamA/TamA family outer membrane protein [Leptolyngbyaceae cyanobacterium MAG.088]|nr:BamA/TamA family outer membrane protein [Leptolyngbyaceae cyanobacterium MAG.088]
MKTNLLLLLRLIQQRRGILSTSLSIAVGPLLLALPSWGQTSNAIPSQSSSEEILSPLPIVDSQPSNLTVPLGNGEIISEIHVRFVNNEGERIEVTAQPNVVARELELQPGDVYDPERALAGLVRIADLYTLNQQATLTLEPTDQVGQVAVAVNLKEPNSFFFTLRSTLRRPTALQGVSRPSTVPALANGSRGLSVGVRLGLANIGDNGQTLSLGVEGGENILGADLDFRQVFEDGSGYGVNFQNQRAIEPEFTGDTEIETPSGDEPWVHRIGGGAEYFRPLGPALDAALGVSYQQISVREDVFSGDIAPNDEFGNDLTVSDDGEDDLLTINLAGILDYRNDRRNPTKGSKLLIGLDQSIPIGDADILFTRLSGNYTQFLPLNLFGFTEGPRTLVLNLQGGTILGDSPPYDSFSLGGSSSVRGYGSGEVGTGESFVQASAEYRFPIFSFSGFRNDDVDVGGTLFFDYATDLGTGDEVIGQPAEVRNKPGDGFGYGIGLRALTSFGPVRLEFGINDEGDTRVIFNVGDRF